MSTKSPNMAQSATVTAVDRDSWLIENGELALRVSLTPEGVPHLTHVEHKTLPDVEWATDGALCPVIQMDGQSYADRPGNPSFVRAMVEEQGPTLCMFYRCPDGLEVIHHLRPSANKAAWVTWTSLSNPTSHDIVGISRFDALRLSLQVSDAEPWVAYLLGWLDGPRADAPGHHAIPYPYPSWIPRLLYGEGAPTPPPPPPGGWSSPVFRLIKERLTNLPLRSGKRSTYDNHPWTTIWDPKRNAGFFLGFQWSGTWKIDVQHDPGSHAVSFHACTDASVHQLKPGETLISPPAFVGLFAGDWDDGFNEFRRYVREEVLPEPLEGFPHALYNIGAPTLPKFAGSFLKDEIDTAAELGFETFVIDAPWWDASLDAGDFSIGLGDFSASRRKFPGGLRAVSDYVHSMGMRFGLWFEFERVDHRTANTGRHPWSPNWLLYQKGQTYRSWCQHVYLLCLGIREAADWALENISWAIREYDLDYIKIDSNEWAICDDPTHDHMTTDGEWAQIQGLYHVLGSLMERFPNLIIENCAGGSQRADLSMARFCRVMACHDTNWPGAINRRYGHGVGCTYPAYYGLQILSYPWPETETTPQQVEWVAFCRMLGLVSCWKPLSTMQPANRAILQKALATYKRLRPTLHGDRYVLAEPAVLIERENQEASNWEIYEFLSLDERMVSVFFFRCASPKTEYRAILRGLAPQATYEVHWHSGRPAEIRYGLDLMEDGVNCLLDQTHSVDVAILIRR